MNKYVINIVGAILWCFGLKKTLLSALLKLKLDNKIFYRTKHSILPTKKGSVLINDLIKLQLLNDKLRNPLNKNIDKYREEKDRIKKSWSKNKSSYNVRDIKFEKYTDKIFKKIGDLPNIVSVEKWGKDDDSGVKLFNKRIDKGWADKVKADNILRDSISVEEIINENKTKISNELKIANGFVSTNGDSITSRDGVIGELVMIKNELTKNNEWYFSNSDGNIELITKPSNYFPVK